MGNEDLGDRLARLTYLCSRISEATRSASVSVETLEEVLAEAEGLSRDLRGRLEKARRRNPSSYPERRSGGDRRRAADAAAAIGDPADGTNPSRTGRRGSD
jgi:hypothetical protein